jgi:type IV pilus assembly protein PilA
VTQLKSPQVPTALLLMAGGFTLLELLVVVVIIGILAAIAVPTLMNQASKAKQVEAKVTIGTLTRAQQAYFIENDKFAEDIASLGVGVVSETTHYRYTVATDGDSVPNGSYALQNAVARNPSLKAYTSMAGVVASGTDNHHLQTITCESDKPQMAAPPPPTYEPTTGLVCAPGTHNVSK